MSAHKLATRTVKIGYLPIYFTEGKDSRLVEYQKETFDTIAEVKEYLKDKPQKTKGYFIVSIRRDVYIL